MLANRFNVLYLVLLTFKKGMMRKLSNWKHLKAEMQSRAVMTNWRGNGVAESSNPPPFLIVYNWC